LGEFGSSFRASTALGRKGGPGIATKKNRALSKTKKANSSQRDKHHDPQLADVSNQNGTPQIPYSVFVY
jgi:hypothetical protein